MAAFTRSLAFALSLCLTAAPFAGQARAQEQTEDAGNSGEAGPAEPGAPLLVLEGDGLTVKILSVADGGQAIRGELRLGETVAPFAGRLERSGPVESLVGTFTVGGDSFDFRTRQHDDEAFVTFTTGTATYKLYPKQTSPPAPPVNPATPNPLDPQGGGVAPPAPAAPVKPNPLAPKVDPAPAPQAPRAPQAGQAGQAGQVKLRTAEFPDVSMGGVVAYTMLVPEGWTSKGEIRWSEGDVVYPQKSIRIESADGRSSVAFFPAMASFYMLNSPEYVQQMRAIGMNEPAEKGVKPPEDVGAWVVEVVRQTNDKVADVRLISAERDAAFERGVAELARQTGAPPPPGETSLVTFEYDEAAVRMREELHLTLAVNPPLEGLGSRTWMWRVYINSDVRAPAASFARQRPMLYALAHSLRPTPKWWAQETAMLAEIGRNRAAASAAAIAARAKSYNETSAASSKAFNDRMAAMDKSQHEFVNKVILDRDDYKNPDGSVVTLPGLYKNVYGDSNGNYVLTDSTLDERGTDFKQLEVAR